MTDFVHPGHVHSINDGDRHWVSGRDLIRLYGLPPSTVIVGPHTLQGRYPNREGDRHFYPRADGNYGRASDAEKSPERQVLDDLSAFRDVQHFAGEIERRQSYERAALGSYYRPEQDTVLADLLDRYRRALRHLVR